MNKIVKLMCLVALVAVVGTSCKKTEKVQSFTGVLSEMTEESKMGINGIKPVYEAGDHVMLYNVDFVDPTNSSSALYEAQTGGSSTTFTPVAEALEPATKLDAFFAYYPGDQCFPDLGVSNRCYFELKPEQTYRGSKQVPAEAMYAACKDGSTPEVGNAVFNFQQIGGILKLRLYSDSGKHVKSIKVTDRYFHLAGFVSMYVDKVNPTTLTSLLNNYDLNNEAYMAELADYKEEVGYMVNQMSDSDFVTYNAQKYITLNCEDVALPNTSANAATFLIGVRPLAFNFGFDIDVEFTDNTHYTMGTSGNNKIKPGVIKSMPVLKVD